MFTLAAVLALHVAMLLWLARMTPEAPSVVRATPMDVRIIETPPSVPPRVPQPARSLTAPPESPRPPPQAKREIVRPAPASRSQPVLTAPAERASAPAPFAVAPQAKQEGAPAPAQPTAPTNVASTVAATPARFDADYLNNPAPAYPSVSRRLQEEGTVLLLVHVTPHGDAERVQVRQGSGYVRLDEAAVRTVQQWRFVPARRGTETIAATVIVPIEFRLGG